MSYDSYRLIFLICAIAAGVMLAAAIVLFFVLKIPRVLGDLTGRTARKAIAGIRSQAEHKDEPSKPGAKGAGAGSRPSGKRGGAEHNTQKLAKPAPGTETAVLNTSGTETTVLNSSGTETTVLNTAGAETTVLNAPIEDTVLAQPGTAPPRPVPPASGETAQLAPSAPPAAAPRAEAGRFELEYEITYVHSAEIIPQN